jgi:hypothetical protein
LGCSAFVRQHLRSRHGRSFGDPRFRERSFDRDLCIPHSPQDRRVAGVFDIDVHRCAADLKPLRQRTAERCEVRKLPCAVLGDDAWRRGHDSLDERSRPDANCTAFICGADWGGAATRSRTTDECVDLATGAQERVPDLYVERRVRSHEIQVFGGEMGGDVRFTDRGGGGSCGILWELDEVLCDEVRIEEVSRADLDVRDGPARSHPADGRRMQAGCAREAPCTDQRR